MLDRLRRRKEKEKWKERKRELKEVRGRRKGRKDGRKEGRMKNGRKNGRREGRKTSCYASEGPGGWENSPFWVTWMGNRHTLFLGVVFLVGWAVVGRTSTTGSK